MRNLVFGAAVGLALAAGTCGAEDLPKAYRSKLFPPDEVLAGVPEVKKHIKDYPSGYVSAVKVLGKIEESPSNYTLYCAEVMIKGADIYHDFKLFTLRLKHLDTDYWVLGESLLQNP